MRWVIIIMVLTLKISHINDAVPKFQHGLVTVVASQKYSTPSFLEQILFGLNYRKEWETPITIPVFDLKKSNFTIKEMGGGKETISLDLIDDKNKEWTLRSVDKNVLMPKKFMENTFMEKIIQDHVSGSYPYASLSVPDIAHAAGVPAGEGNLFFIPDDTAFGKYRTMVANKIFILLNKEPVEGKDLQTAEMLAKLDSGKIYFVDQKAYLKARLVDWLIADWDRHENQWRWVERNTDAGIAFEVVPRDHDQAFYRCNGMLAGLISLFFMPELNKFNKDCHGIKELSKKARELDKRFTCGLSKEDWENSIHEFQKNITDSVIATAIKRQPKEIFAIHGNDLIKKLISRRNEIFTQAMKYYSFLRCN